MKSFRTKLVRYGITGGVLMSSVILGFNCSPFISKQVPSLDQASSSPAGTSNQAPLSVALLSSEQILKTMLSATGTENSGDPTADDDLINQTYALRSGSLPSDQNLSLATGPMMIAVTNLASAVCAKAVDRDMAVGQAQASDRLFFREFDFTKGLSGQPQDSVTLAFERLGRNAWRRDVMQNESDAMATFANEFSAAATDPNSDISQTRLLAISVCTAVVSSIDALTY